MATRHKTILLAMVACILFCGHTASSQGGRNPTDYVVDIDINYGFAYRDGTWVPVDVQFTNPKAAIKGWVEIRTFDFNGQYGPVYRLPIDSPKGSRKRFQVYCYLQGADHIEARIYDGNREVLPLPVREDTAVINAEDKLAMVLDDDGAGLNFLYMALNAGNEKQGLHRANIASNQLAYLPEYAQCYEAWDVIIMGETQPENISVRHRELIEDYVRQGGRLAVCVGANAKAYANTWVEELLGITVGQAQAMKKSELAEAAFPGAQQVKSAVRPDDGGDCLVATLTPRDASVKKLGANVTVATRRAIGAGAVYAVAVDADSEVLALQDLAPYHELWREICTRTRGPRPLNFNAVGNTAAALIPQISGIVIHSRASVMTYLALYFLVGIVGNWLFFNWLKRREWAWVMLIVFSLGFTSYAMIFGTTGRARVSELEQIEVLHVPKDGGRSSLTSIVGVLTAHTSNYTLSLSRDHSLAFDALAGTGGPWGGYNQNQVQRGQRSFRVVQGESPRIEDFRVGASELRLARVESEVETEGGIEGVLTLDKGGLKGQLKNDTGRRLTRAWLFFDGRLFPLTLRNNTVEVNIAANQLQQPTAFNLQPFNYQYMGYSQYGGSSEGAATSALDETFPQQLFLDDTARPNNPFGGMPNVSMSLRTDIGPFLCGWVEGEPLGAISVEGDMRTAMAKSFLVADVEIQSPEQALSDLLYSWRDLETWIVTPQLSPHTTSFDSSSGFIQGEAELTNSVNLPCGGSTRIVVMLPDSVVKGSPGDLELTIRTLPGDFASSSSFSFLPLERGADAAKEPAQQCSTSINDIYGGSFLRLVLTDWQTYQNTEWARPMLALRKEPGQPHIVPFPQDGTSPFRENEPVTRTIEGTLKHNLLDRCVNQTPHAHTIFLSGRVKLMTLRQELGDTLPWQ